MSDQGDEPRVTLELLEPGDLAAPVVQRLAADAVGRVHRRESRRAELRSRSRAQLLAELLGGTAEQSTIVAERARAHGLRVDGWHRVARLELADRHGGDPLADEERMDAVEPHRRPGDRRQPRLDDGRDRALARALLHRRPRQRAAALDRRADARADPRGGAGGASVP